MASKRFRHLGQEWDVTRLGTSHGVGFGFLPQITSWSAEFACVSKPELGKFRGRIPAADPNTVPDHGLQQALEDGFVVETLRRSSQTWRTVESLSNETGVGPARVYRILEWESNDVVQSDLPDSQGRVLYAARERYAETTPFVKRYLDVLSSST